MEKNVGKTDKMIRILVAIIFVVVGYIYTPWLYILSAMLILTSLFSFCGAYKLFGINTCKVK